MRTVDGKHFYDCELCGREYQQGPGIYDGEVLALYGGMGCCKSCFDWNHDGWNDDAAEKLLAICAEQKIEVPQRLSNGRLPRGGHKDGYKLTD